MKNLKLIFVVLAALPLVLAGCGDLVPPEDEGKGPDNSDIIGLWTGTGDEGTIELQIASDNFTFVYSTYVYTGSWRRENNVLVSELGTGTLAASGSLILQLYPNTKDGDFSEIAGLSFTLTKSGSSNAGTRLTIVNESFIVLTEVIWSGISFGTIPKGGGSVTKSVSAGTGYLRFKTQSNPLNFRMVEIIESAEGENKKIVITDNTIIAEEGSPGNTGPLSTLGVPATLKIKNESFVALTNVVWSGVSFGTIQTGGGSVTKNVDAGTGYLTFKANDISLRISEIVTVEAGGETTITIIDSTVVADVNNTSNTGPLSTLGVPVLGTPSKPALTIAGDGGIQASWQAVSGATEYRVYYSTETTPPETPALSVTGTSAAISGLTYGTTYYVWVQAVNARSESSLNLMAQILVVEPTTTLAWSGFWIKNNDTSYTSNTVGHNSSTWQTLTITTTAGCRVIVMLTASCESTYDGGYASKLDGGQTTATGMYQFQVSGNASQTYTYEVPAGTHKIYFGYVKDGGRTSLNDNVTVSVLVE